jgi:hypothetical protein
MYLKSLEIIDLLQCNNSSAAMPQRANQRSLSDSMFYETLIATMIFLVIRQRFPEPEGARLYFWLTVALCSASRVFLEHFAARVSSGLEVFARPK